MRTTIVTHPETFSFNRLQSSFWTRVNGNELKSVKVVQNMQSSIADGKYSVVFDRVRDDAGNAGVDGYTDGVLNDWTIELR